MLAMLAPFAAAASSPVPPAVVSSVSTLPAPGLGPYYTDPAIDACGNLYVVQSGAYYSLGPNYSAVPGGQITEIPAGGGTPIMILAAEGPSYDDNSLWMDAAKSNLYVTEGANTTAVPDSAIRIPIVNCVPQPSEKSGISITNLGAISYYYSAGAVASDAAGDVFIATNVACCAKVDELLEESPSGTGTVLLPDMSAAITSMTIDASGNIYFVTGGATLYELTYSAGAYSTTPISFQTGYIDAVGVSLDSVGNLYVSDYGNPKAAENSAVYEIPNEGVSGLNPADQYIVAVGVGITGPVAIDTSGNLYFTELYSSNAGETIYELTRANANLGSVAVGSSATSTMNVVFNTATTPSAISFVTSNGVFASAKGTTCAANTAYAVAATCVVSAAFTPVTPGLAQSAFVMTDSAGAVLASAGISGTGLGAGLTADPGTVASIGSGFKTPQSVALDSAGDLFIADSGNSAVWEIARGSTTPVAIGSGLSSPAGVAADGVGNVYIADTGNNRIVEVPVVNGALSTSAQIVLVSSSTEVAGSALKGPAGLSTDAQGNLYIADTGNNRVVFLPQSNNWNAAGAFTLGSGFSDPLATTVSSSGLIYIADSGNGKVYSIAYPGPSSAQTLVATGFNDPSALATDAAGDLFVVDEGNSQVVRIPNIAGGLVTTSILDVSLGIADPYGLTIDPAGNLYIADDVNAAAYVVTRTNSTQSFGKWNPKTVSDPASFQVENSGNQALTLGTPFYVASGNTAAFTQVSTETNACANSAMVAVGASCTLQATFDPPALGIYSETLALTSNAKNASAPQVIFDGTGATTSATTTTLAVTSPSGTPYYGQAIALKVSVTATTGTPTGSVALLVDGVQEATSLLSNGIADFSLAEGLTGGSHTLQAAYQGAVTGLIVFSRSDSPIDTITVSKVPTYTAIYFSTLYNNPVSQPAGAAFSLNASVGSTHQGILTGTVAFTIAYQGGATVTVSAPLTAANGGGFQATYSYTPTTPANGVNYVVASVRASYSGDGNFSGSGSGSQSFDVAPAAGSVVTGASGARITGASSITFTSTSYGGWQGVVGYQCLASSLPANAICVFSPGQVTVQASTSYAPYPPPTTKMTIVVNNPPNSPAQSSMISWLGGLTGLFLFWMRRRMRRGALETLCMLFAAALLAASAFTLTACSSGVRFATPAGTSTVTIYASADPFTSGSTSTTQACGIIPGSNPATASPALAPCSQQTFLIDLTVQ
jgi:sugar lactone lactonase YvrE